MFAACDVSPPNGNPVAFVKVPLVGVPKAPLKVTRPPVALVALASAVETPVPGLIDVPHALPVDTAIPAPEGYVMPAPSAVPFQVSTPQLLYNA